MPKIDGKKATMCTTVKTVKNCKTLRTSKQQVVGCKTYVTPATSAKLLVDSPLGYLNGCLECIVAAEFQNVSFIKTANTYASAVCAKTAIFKTAATECAIIANCKQLACLNDSDKSVDATNQCQRCKAEYVTKEYTAGLTAKYGTDTCTAVAPNVPGLVANCTQYGNDAGGLVICYECKKDYVLEGTGCKESKTNYAAFCRVQTSATVCTVCRDTYVFNGAICATSSAKLVGFAFIALSALFFN